MFCQIGDIQFEKANTPSAWNTDYTWTWADQQRIQGKPASQAIAPDLETHEISGVFLSGMPGIVSVDDAVESLFDAANAMKPLAFFTGHAYVSKVTIRKIGINRRVTRPDGKLECVEFSLELTEFVDTETRKDDAPWD